MLTVELRVNGSLITAIDIVNRTPGTLAEDEYSWRCVRFPLRQTESAVVQSGTVKHVRSEGAEVLVKKILEGLPML